MFTRASASIAACASLGITRGSDAYSDSGSDPSLSETNRAKGPTAVSVAFASARIASVAFATAAAA